MIMLTVLVGEPALSPAGLARLQKRLTALDVAAPLVGAQWWYLVGTEGAALDAAEATLLAELFAARAVTATDANHALWVTPRQGTLSPWASKAKDILVIAGLSVVTRLERVLCYQFASAEPAAAAAHARVLCDRMTQRVVRQQTELASQFVDGAARPLATVALGTDALAALRHANNSLGLALTEDEVVYLADAYRTLQRDPTDAELMMFAQANSEHCRHKIFNARWIIDGAAQPASLFGMIRNTHALHPGGVLSAYKDNAAIIAGSTATRVFPDAGGHYRGFVEPAHILAKVETHNHQRQSVRLLVRQPALAARSATKVRPGAVANPRPASSVLRFQTCAYPKPWSHGSQPPMRGSVSPIALRRRSTSCLKRRWAAPHLITNLAGLVSVVTFARLNWQQLRAMAAG